MTADAPPLVIRFGRLGDLVLTWPALADLAARRGGPLELVTAAQYAGLMGSLPWVARVWSLPIGAPNDLAALRHLAGDLRRAGHGPVFDLHGSLRSRVLCGLLGGAQARVDKDSLGRRARLGVRRGDRRWRLRRDRRALPTFPRRFLDAVGADAAAHAVPRWPGSAGDARGPDAGPPRLALLPAARRATKRWRTDRFAELARGWRAETGGASIVFHGPGEAELARQLVADAGGAARRHRALELPDVLAGLARCDVAVGGDTGLLHLAGAAGARLIGLFGPTAADTGYWPWASQGRAVVPALGCHPCTMYGGEACPLGHHDCLARLDAASVLRWALAELRR